MERFISPWNEEEFRGEYKPVVCISAIDALNYCKWLHYKIYDQNTKFSLIKKRIAIFRREKSQIRLPLINEWNLATFSSIYPSNDPKYRSLVSNSIHHKDKSPIETDRHRKRANKFGFSDLIGNVWEWCMEIYNINNITGSISIQSSATPKRPEISANGGGFLDDVTNVKSLSISEHQLLPDKSKTSHNDLGFWICAEIDIEDLNEEQQHGIKEYYANQRKVINASIMDV